MTAPTIDALPPSPNPLDPRNFAPTGVVFAQALPTFRAQLNALGEYINVTIAPLAGSVAGAAASAESAAISAAEALAQAGLAQDYAEAAQIAAGVYDTIAEGRAAVADGEYFKVIAEGSDMLEALTLYRRDSSSTQTLIMEFVSADDFAAEADARIAAAIGVSVQGWSASLDTLGAASPTAAGLAVLEAADAPAQRTALGVAIGTDVQAYSATLTTWAGKTAPAGTVVGTTDAQTLTNKTLTSPAISTPTGIVKGDVGLGNVDNTSDANKPVSTATQTALDAKLAHTGGELTDYRVNWLDKGNSGSGTVTVSWADGNVQRIARTGAFTLAFSNIPASGAYAEQLIEAVNWGAGAVTFPTVNWVQADGTVTTSFATYGITLQTSGTDWILFWTRTGSTTVYGKVIR